MIVTTVTASYAAKRSNGHWGSNEAFCSMSAALDEVEDADEAYAELFARCRRNALQCARNEAKKEEVAK